MPPITVQNEDELVALLRQQSQEAFSYLYRNYAGVLFGVVKKVLGDDQTSEDALQEAFVKIWNNIGQYDSGKGRLYTWMLNVCRNTAIDKLRSKGEIMRGKIQTGEDVVDNIQKGLKTEQATDSIGVRKLVGTLKPEYQSIVDLAYFKGFTLDEISKTLDVPLGTVKTRMRHAMQLLRQKF